MRKSILFKSLRTIWRHKRSYIACISVLAIGMAVFVGMLSASIKIDEASDIYFEKEAFADVFATVLSMPQSGLTALEKIDGIKTVEGKLTKSVKGIKDGDLIRVRLISMDFKEPPTLNLFTLNGSQTNNPSNIWLGKVFYNKNTLSEGMPIELIVNGRMRQFNIAGSAESPEYLVISGYDDSKNTVGYIEKSLLEELTNQQGMVTDISIGLEKGVKFEDIELALKSELKKYGMTGLFKMKDHVSHIYLKSNVTTLSSIATIIPVLFLLVSIIMLYIMLKRFIEQERAEIGTFKAFGYSNAEIIYGYFIYGAVTGIAGFLLSLVGGYFIGNYYFTMILTAFNVPMSSFVMSSAVCIWALVLSIGVSFTAVSLGARSVTKIHPAEAMRAAVPTVKTGKFKMDGKIIKTMLNQRGIMALRGISRSRVRSMLTVLSIVMSFSLTNVLIAFSISFTDAMTSVTDITEKHDIHAVLDEFTPLNSAIQDIKRLGGVSEAEGLLTVPSTLYFKNRKKELSIYGISKTSQLYNVVDEGYNIQEIPDNGLLINTRVAQQLNVSEGDVVEVESPYLRENIFIIVSKIITEPMGVGCYMEFSQLNKIIGQSDITNFIMLNTDSFNKNRIMDELIYAPNVRAAIDQERSAQLIREGSVATTGLLYMLVIMSLCMCFGVIYNVSRISMAEKQRELATMRILGFSVGETAEVNSFEHWVLFVIGCVLGFFLALVIKDPIAANFSSDENTFIINLSVMSTLYSAVGCTIAVMLSNYMAKRQIGKYKLVEVLKERE